MYNRLFSASLLFICCLLISAGPAFAQQKGSPFLRNFEPSEYQLHNQTWDITQTPEGHIAIATGSGISIFDGEEFRPLKGTALMVTDLITSSTGGVYYSANNVFGQIATNNRGISVYNDLTERIDSTRRNFGPSRNLLEFKDKIYMPGNDHLLRYSGEHFEYTGALQNAFFRAFAINQTFYVGETDTGLLQLNETGELEPAPGGEQFASDKMPYFMLPFDENRALVGTARSGLFLYYIKPEGPTPKGTLVPFPNEINERLISGTISEGIQLQNGNYAIGTSTAGVFIMNRDGEFIQKIDEAAGLQSEVINGLYEDRQSNLWMALNYGVAMAEINNPISYYNEKNGLEGTVLSARRIGNSLYAATSTGLYKKNNTRFELNPGVTSATWDLAEFRDPDSPDNPQLLAGNSFGLFLLDENETRQLRSNFTSAIRQSTHHPNRIYAGTPEGLYYLEKQGDQFIAGEEFLEFGNPVRQIIEDENGGIWAATQSDGLRYIQPDFNPETVKEYRKTDDYFVSHNATLQQTEGELFVSTISNFYRYDEQKDTFNEWRSPGLEEDALLGVYRFYYNNGTLWAGASNQREQISQIESVFSDSATITDAPFRTIPSTVTLAIEEQNGKLWFGNALGLYQYSPESTVANIELPEPQIRTVEIITDTTRTIRPGNHPDVELPFSNARLRFKTTFPWFNSDRSTVYRYRLEGLDEQWSGWTDNHIVEYTSLWENSYTFAVQARNREGVKSAVTEYSFVVNAPWYRTVWAYAICVLLFIGVIYGSAKIISRMKTQRLEAFNRKLEKQVKERSAEIRKQNEQLQKMNDEKNEFMNIAAHDLRSPLSGIQGLSEMLASPDQTSPEEVQQYGSMIHDSSRRMFELIDNYLNVHRIEDGAIEPQPEPVSLNQAASNAVSRFKLQAQNKQMELNISTSGDEHVIVFADPSMTSQVLDNLISNAIKYSPPSSPIQITVGGNDKFGTIIVKDDGPGLSKSDQEKLYQKFARLSSEPTGGEVSTGLGLSIVKQLTEIMDGTITCQSKLGKGTAFKVSLPLASAG